MIKIQGHRGFSELYPENTMLSFQKTYEAGAFGIETDVRTTSDGQFVLIHDTTIDRTTDGTGSVSSLTLDYIKSLDAGSWKGSEFAGRADCKIPTLDEMLTEFQGKDITLILHLYVGSTANVYSVIDKVVSKGMINNVHIFGDISAINAAKQYNNNLFTYNGGMATIGNYQTFLNNAVQNNHNAVSIDANSSYNDLQTMINAIKEQGKLVHASYVQINYENTLNTHISLGTDFILGNNPLIMQNHINESNPDEPEPSMPSGLYYSPTRWIKTDFGNIKGSIYVKTDYGIVKANTFFV